MIPKTKQNREFTPRKWRQDSHFPSPKPIRYFPYYSREELQILLKLMSQDTELGDIARHYSKYFENTKKLAPFLDMSLLDKEPFLIPFKKLPIHLNKYTKDTYTGIWFSTVIRFRFHIGK